MNWSFSWESGWQSLWAEPFLNRWRSAFRPDSAARVSPFMHPAVLRAWAETIGLDERDILLLKARHSDGRKIVQIMVRENRHFPMQSAKVLKAFGWQRFDFTEPLIFPSADGGNVLEQDFWEALRSELKRGPGRAFDRIEFPRVRDDTLGRYRPTGTTDVAPYIEISRFASIDAYMDTRSGRRRRSLRRRIKLCEEAGEFSFQVLGPEHLDRILSWIPSIAREKRRKFPNDPDLDQFEAFLTNLVREALPSGTLCCSSCSIDGKDVSWAIDFTVGDELLQYVADYDPDYREYGLGNVHTYFQLAWTIEHGFRYFNFMWGNEAYKSDWTEGDEQTLYAISFDSDWPPSRLRLLADRTVNLYLRLRKNRRLKPAAPLTTDTSEMTADNHPAGRMASLGSSCATPKNRGKIDVMPTRRLDMSGMTPHHLK